MRSIYCNIRCAHDPCTRHTNPELRRERTLRMLKNASSRPAIQTDVARIASRLRLDRGA